MKRRKKMNNPKENQKRIMPYQSIEVNKDLYKNLYWDYNFKIKGVIYEASVDKNTGELFINKDEYQGGN